MKLFYIFLSVITIALISGLNSCNQTCINEVFAETLEMNFEVNSGNLGIFSGEVKNSGDTIKSSTNQFYNFPEFRRFGQLKMPGSFFIKSAYAAEPCPERLEYVSRMDLEKTTFRINKVYDASSVGVGLVPADSNLLSYIEIKDAYLSDFADNIFIAAGAPGPLTISPDFFDVINDQWVTFYFTFEEADGTIFEDSVQTYIDLL